MPGCANDYLKLYWVTELWEGATDPGHAEVLWLRTSATDAAEVSLNCLGGDATGSIAQWLRFTPRPVSATV
jgi:hypothetical protein